MDIDDDILEPLDVDKMVTGLANFLKLPESEVREKMAEVIEELES